LATDLVPATVRRFVEGHFDTVTAVEVLLLLRRESPRALSSDAVARQLRIDPDQTEGILTGLDRSGLVRRQGPRFEYEPRTDEVAGEIETLADVYSRYRHRIIRIIFEGSRS
jgi:DNA-binding IclR family transcriptional regulator